MSREFLQQSDPTPTRRTAELTGVLRQLGRWRFRERLVRLAWGGARLLAICGTLLALACFVDWAIDRYAGSQTWQDFLKSSWVVGKPDPLSAGETPFWFRVLMTLGQVAVAGTLAYYFLIRPWMRTPPVDELAFRAERAFPAFDHRLVTALQLNRDTARTEGMSPALIAEVTKEAGEIADRHDLLTLIDYRRLLWALVAVAPVLLAWGIFFAVNSTMAAALVERQALLDTQIPRKPTLENVSQEVWPTGSEVTIRFKVTEGYDISTVGIVRIVPDDNPSDYIDRELRHETSENGEAFFVATVKNVPGDFKFHARLGAGRTDPKYPGHIRFEPPPQLDEKDGVVAAQILPDYLGKQPNGQPYIRRNNGWQEGHVNDCVPQAEIQVQARFNKPVKEARLVRIRHDGKGEHLLQPLPPLFVSGKDAAWRFPSSSDLVGYRLELVDSNGFKNPTLIRRDIRMLAERPPLVVLRPESTRDPNPSVRGGQGNPKDYEWEMPIGPNGRVQVIYNVSSPLGVKAAYLVYRVIPRGIPLDEFPENIQKIQHPRDDPSGLVYKRLTLSPFPGDVSKMGPFVPDLGKFQNSGKFGEVEYYSLPSMDPKEEPADLTAAGCKIFQISDLKKLVPDGTGKLIEKPIEIGDTVEIYVEAYDKYHTPDVRNLDRRYAGYPFKAKQKIVYSETAAEALIRARDEERQKLSEKLLKLAEDQARQAKPPEPK